MMTFKCEFQMKTSFMMVYYLALKAGENLLLLAGQRDERRERYLEIAEKQSAGMNYERLGSSVFQNYP